MKSKTSLYRFWMSFLVLFIFPLSAKAQLYFPPTETDDWETISPSTLGWCDSKIDSLNTFLNANNTKAFILLKDGKIVLEEYYNGHSQNMNWYWASAGKTLKAFTIGIAQQENFLQISDPVSNYLGSSWSSLNPSQEELISIYHQLSMTTGLDDTIEDQNCTTNDCLTFLANPGERWAYYNAPYLLLDQVLENATDQTLNSYINQKIKIPTGMNGLYLPVDGSNVFFSDARSMARFGLLILNEGNWNGNPILTDLVYYNAMINASQDLNQSYGYLWWLNGKESFMIPQTQIVFNGSMFPNAPNDMISALGKNGQFINVVPSENMVWIRMGDAPDDSLISFNLNNEIWEYLNELECEPLSTQQNEIFKNNIEIFPNPTSNELSIKSPYENLKYVIYTLNGKIVRNGIYTTSLDLIDLDNGMYFIEISYQNKKTVVKFIKND